MSPAHILVVEDEPHIAMGVIENLEIEGYRVTHAEDGAAGLAAIRAGGFDLILLDVMLPHLDGFEVCQMARAEGLHTPVLFLTARGALDDRVRGLQVGGDDYLPKPFHLNELLTRVQAILRRQAWASRVAPQDNALRFGGNTVDIGTWAATAWDGARHELTEKEVLLLQALHEHAGQVLTREQVLEKVWGYDVFPSTRAIDALIQRLRRRFEPAPDAPLHIHTIRGVGYRLTLSPESP